jgi:arylsulfatase A
MSDNGAAGKPRSPQNTPLTGGKGTLYEGGIRIPLIIRGPGIKAGSQCDTSVTGCDLYPTLCEWAGVKIGKVDGTSILPLLAGTSDKFQRKESSLLFHSPHYGQGPNQKPQSAIIVDNYKLLKNLESGTYQLFNLDKDISENSDLSKKLPEKTAELIKIMDLRLKSVKAQMPAKNQNYDPSAQPTRRRGPPGRRR